MPVYDDFDLVYFRAILSDDGPEGDILHIAALQGDRPFGVWIRPSKPIPSTALPRKQGLHLRYLDLFLHNQKLRTLSLDDALTSFLKFLKASPKRVLLVGHFANFEFMHLLRAIRKTGMDDSFDRDIAGFLDGVKIFWQKFPNRGELQQYSLPALCQDFSHTIYTGHPLNSLYALHILKYLVTNEILPAKLALISKSYREAYRSLLENESS